MQLRQGRSSFTAVLTLALCALAGCVVVPLPGAKTETTGKAVTTAQTGALRVGVSTRQEVIAQLGEPTEDWEAERVLLYRWTVSEKGYQALLVLTPVPLPLDILKRDRASGGYAALIEFDGHDRLRRVERMVLNDPTPPAEKIRMWVRQGLTDRMRTIQPGVSRQHDVRSALGLPQYWRESERTVVYDWWRAGLAMQFRYDERGVVAGMATLDSPVSPEGRTRCWQVGPNQVVLFLKLETRHPHATPGQPIDAKTRLSDNPKVLLNRHGEARAFMSKWCGYEHYLEGWTYFSVVPGKYTLRVATHGSPDVMASEYLPVPGWIIDVPGHVDGLYLGTLPVQAESDAGAGQRGLRYSPAPGPPAITDAGFAEARSVARDCGPEITLSRPY